jgi:hypothetical protein
MAVAVQVSLLSQEYADASRHGAFSPLSNKMDAVSDGTSGSWSRGLWRSKRLSYPPGYCPHNRCVRGG